MEEVTLRTFESLKVRNFRLYIFGQGLSSIGTWVQAIALSWLVLRLTGSGVGLGTVLAAQFLPVLVLSSYGGVLVDRYSKKMLLIITQVLFGLIALLIGIFVLDHQINIRLIYIFALLLGIVNSVASPAIQAFLFEMVGSKYIKNAVTLNTIMVNLARILGPVFAGFLILFYGVGICFIINAISFIFVIIALVLIRNAELIIENSKKTMAGILDGFSYILSNSNLKLAIVLIAIIGTFAYEFTVVFPLLATKTFDGNAETYSIMMTTLGIGAVLGGVFVARRKNTIDQNDLLISGLVDNCNNELALVIKLIDCHPTKNNAPKKR